LKIQKGLSEIISQHKSMTDNTITNEKRNNGRQKTQDSATQTLLKTGVERCSAEWQACSPYSISSTLRVTVKWHETSSCMEIVL